MSDKILRKYVSEIDHCLQNFDNKNARLSLSQQKEIIEEKNKEVTDSIRYAKRIQDALLPSEKFMERTLKRLKKM